jgi:Spy/CpxP family protein refolding chaperone
MRPCLTPDQQRRLEVLEHDHAAKRTSLEAEMRAANAELAQAYQEGHAYTPKVQAAIDRFHRAMDALQTETMLHVLAMRQILTPDQTAQFDETVVKSLTAEPM